MPITPNDIMNKLPKKQRLKLTVMNQKKQKNKSKITVDLHAFRKKLYTYYQNLPNTEIEYHQFQPLRESVEKVKKLSQSQETDVLLSKNHGENNDVSLEDTIKFIAMGADVFLFLAMDKYCRSIWDQATQEDPNTPVFIKYYLDRHFESIQIVTNRIDCQIVFKVGSIDNNAFKFKTPTYIIQKIDSHDSADNQYALFFSNNHETPLMINAPNEAIISIANQINPDLLKIRPFNSIEYKMLKLLPQDLNVIFHVMQHSPGMAQTLTTQEAGLLAHVRLMLTETLIKTNEPSLITAELELKTLIAQSIHLFNHYMLSLSITPQMKPEIKKSQLYYHSKLRVTLEAIEIKASKSTHPDIDLLKTTLFFFIDTLCLTKKETGLTYHDYQNQLKHLSDLLDIMKNRSLSSNLLTIVRLEGAMSLLFESFMNEVLEFKPDVREFQKNKPSFIERVTVIQNHIRALQCPWSNPFDFVTLMTAKMNELDSSMPKKPSTKKKKNKALPNTPHDESINTKPLPLLWDTIQSAYPSMSFNLDNLPKFVKNIAKNATKSLQKPVFIIGWSVTECFAKSEFNHVVEIKVPLHADLIALHKTLHPEMRAILDINLKHPEIRFFSKGQHCRITSLFNQDEVIEMTHDKIQERLGALFQYHFSQSALAVCFDSTAPTWHEKLFIYAHRTLSDIQKNTLHPLAKLSEKLDRQEETYQDVLKMTEIKLRGDFKQSDEFKEQIKAKRFMFWTEEKVEIAVNDDKTLSF